MITFNVKDRVSLPDSSKGTIIATNRQSAIIQLDDDMGVQTANFATLTKLKED